MGFQRVAALALNLRVQLQAAILALVAVQVVAAVHGNHSGLKNWEKNAKNSQKPTTSVSFPCGAITFKQAAPRGENRSW